MVKRQQVAQNSQQVAPSEIDPIQLQNDLQATMGNAAIQQMVANQGVCTDHDKDEEAARELWGSMDSGLQEELDEILAELGLLNEPGLTLALVDLRDPTDPRVATKNADEMRYAASLPKIAILAAAMTEVEAGNMVLDDATKESLTRMIRKSSNRDATAMLNAVGKDRTIEVMQETGLYNPEVGGGLWVGKEYASGTAYQRSPIGNFSHGATAMQAANFFYLMETGNLVNCELTAEMKTMLGDPGIKHKFVAGLAEFPDVEIYRKSGSWRDYHADAAMVEADGVTYIIAALAQNASGGSWLKELIKPIHQFMVSEGAEQSELPDRSLPPS